MRSNIYQKINRAIFKRLSTIGPICRCQSDLVSSPFVLRYLIPVNGHCYLEHVFVHFLKRLVIPALWWVLFREFCGHGLPMTTLGMSVTGFASIHLMPYHTSMKKLCLFMHHLLFFFLGLDIFFSKFIL